MRFEVKEISDLDPETGKPFWKISFTVRFEDIQRAMEALGKAEEACGVKNDFVDAERIKDYLAPPPLCPHPGSTEYYKAMHAPPPHQHTTMEAQMAAQQQGMQGMQGIKGGLGGLGAFFKKGSGGK